MVDDLADGHDILGWELEESEAVGSVERDACECGFERTACFGTVGHWNMRIVG